MPMKIECADCAGWTGLFNKCKTCKGSKKITVHTTAELKQAQVHLLEWLYKANKIRIHSIIANQIQVIKHSMQE